MKLDREQVVSLGIAGTKNDSKPLNQNVNALDSLDLKTGNETLKENEDNNLSQSSRKMNSLKDSSVFYVDKSVTERELPKLVVYCNESTYHVVKDICVDEGVRSKEKFLFDSCPCEKRVCSLPSQVNVTEAEVMKEGFDADVPSKDLWKSSAEGKKEDYVPILDTFSSPDENDSSSKCDSTGLMQTGELKGHRAEKISKLEVKQDSLQGPAQDTVMKAARGHVDPENCCGGEALVSYSTPDSVELLTGHEEPTIATASQNSAVKKSGDVFEETLSGSHPTVSEATESGCQSGRSTNSSVEESSPDSKMEIQHINCNSELFSSQNTSRQEESDVVKMNSNKLQHNSLGETSFSAAVSGQIAYSGSLSHRSDSSTTSTRSFAFPILQPEWNTSPVRMAKADRRQKNKSWRHCLCCKF